MTYLPREQLKQFLLNVILKERIENWIDSTVGNQHQINRIYHRRIEGTCIGEIAETAVIPSEVRDIEGGHHQDNQDSGIPVLCFRCSRWVDV